MHPRETQQYHLEIKSHTEEADNGNIIKRHWACLWENEFRNSQCVTKTPTKYIQHLPPSQCETLGVRNISCSFIDPDEIGTIKSWAASPNLLWDFIEDIRDNYYRSEIENKHLPITLELNRIDGGHFTDWYGSKDYAELFFRNRQGDVQFVNWNGREIYGCPKIPTDGDFIRSILTEFAKAYENPMQFKTDWCALQLPMKSTPQVGNKPAYLSD